MRTKPTHRVVITGMGAITPLGNSVPAFWEGMLAGRSGVRLATRYDIADFPYVIAAEVHDFDPRNHMDAKAARRTARFIKDGGGFKVAVRLALGQTRVAQLARRYPLGRAVGQELERATLYGQAVAECEVLGQLAKAFSRPERTSPTVRSRGRNEPTTIDAFLTDLLGDIDRYWTTTLRAGGLPVPRVRDVWVQPGGAILTARFPLPGAAPGRSSRSFPTSCDLAARPRRSGRAGVPHAARPLRRGGRRAPSGPTSPSAHPGP